LNNHTNQKLEPIIKMNTRILYPFEYRLLLENNTSKKYDTIMRTCLHSCMRYTELQYLKDNPNIFKDNRYIALDKEGIKKPKCRLKERHIRLSLEGRRAVKEFVKSEWNLPTRQGFTKFLRKLALESGLSQEGIQPKMWRKTGCSWLISTSDTRNPFEVLNSIGHSYQVSIERYQGLPFSMKDKNDINLIMMGWND